MIVARMARVTDSLVKLSRRQRDCLRLVWDRQATSKEIAIELGISKTTVDGYIAEAVEQLGARDRRDAAALAFGGVARAGSGTDPIGVPAPTSDAAKDIASTGNPAASRAWRTRRRPGNTLTFAQTIGWIAVIAIGSLLALTLATVFANGVAPVARAVLGSLVRQPH